MYCSKGVAVLIPHEDKLKFRSCSRGGGILDPLKIKQTISTNVLLRGGGSFDLS